MSCLIERYFESAEFQGLNVRIEYVRRLILGHIAATDGNKPYKLLETKHVRRMRDLKAKQPEAANGRVKALRAVYAWAVLPSVELVTTNPAKDVPYIEVKGDGQPTRLAAASISLAYAVGIVPPSITCSVPVIDAARSEARKAIRLATSSASTGRPRGMPPSESMISLTPPA